MRDRHGPKDQVFLGKIKGGIFEERKEDFK
jgi:hypothetical protein